MIVLIGTIERKSLNLMAKDVIDESAIEVHLSRCSVSISQKFALNSIFITTVSMRRRILLFLTFVTRPWRVQPFLNDLIW